MAFIKHVNQTDNYQFDFKNLLDKDSGESLQNPTVEVLKKDDNGGWTDITSEFGSLSSKVDGTDNDKVTFTLNERSSLDEQEDSPYLVYCEVDTTDGRQLIDTGGLITIKTGDKDD